MAFGPLLSLCLLAASALTTPIEIGSSPITLPIAIQVNSTGGPQALLQRDRARFKALYARGQAQASGDFSALATIPVPVTNVAVTYTAQVGVGAGTYSLIVDTGSSNTWVGSSAPYKPGRNSHDTGASVRVSYGSGSFSGEEFTDDVILGSATISRQSIGVSSRSLGFSCFDGILGIGPVALTRDTTSDGKLVPTVTDNLRKQGTISKALIGVSYVPTTSLNTKSGVLHFGGTDSSKYTGNISYTPITGTSPSSSYWGIDQSITFGSASGTTILKSTAGIVDTGTTLIYLATDAFKKYQAAVGGRIDEDTGLLTVRSVSNLKSLFFHIGGKSFELTPNAQIWPRKFNSKIGGVSGKIYLVVADSGDPSGQGMDFINGFAFLQRFYSVYDTDNSRVGFATTTHTKDITN